VVLEITCGERTIVAEILPAAGGPRMVVDGRDMECDWVKLPDGHYSLIIEGKIFDLAVRADGDFLQVSGRGGKYKLKVRDPRRLRPQETAEEGTTGLQRLYAEMPGKIIRLLVRRGDAVAYDQPLLVIEAMKMQNEIRTPKTGIIREIAVAEGNTVASGEFLLSVE